MPAFKLPRLQFRLPIVDNMGMPTRAFLDFFNVQFAGKLEQQEAAQAETLEILAAQQATIEAQQEQIIEALELANIAIGLTGGNSGSNFVGISIIGDTWQAGPQVDLLGVVAGTLTIPGSGLFTLSGTTTQNADSLSGEVRLVEIDGGDTVIGGPWAFTSDRTDPVLGTIYIVNPSEINALSLPLTTTGDIGYRLDFRMDGPTDEINDATARLYVRRTT